MWQGKDDMELDEEDKELRREEQRLMEEEERRQMVAPPPAPPLCSPCGEHRRARWSRPPRPRPAPRASVLAERRARAGSDAWWSWAGCV